MFMELNVILWNNNKESLIWRLNFSKFKNLLIIIINFTRERKRSDVNQINLWIFTSKYSWNLRIFSMLKFIHCRSFPFINRNTIDVNLNSSLWFDLRPFSFELVHHILPFKKRFLFKFFNFESSVLLKLEKTIFSLDDCCFCH